MSPPSRSCPPASRIRSHWFVESGAACIGTPDDAIAFIERLLQGTGGFGVIMELAHNWADWDATQAAL